MKASRSTFALMRTSVVAAIFAAGAGTGSIAWAQGANCNPACAAGQVCVQGTCMVPAPPPPAAYPPPPAYAQPPGAYQPPPAGAPAPDYQQQPPQAGAPAYAVPPVGNGYPPSQGNGYPPPQGYAQPQGNGYPPPPPAAYAPPPPTGRHGFLAMPYLGIHSFVGDNATADNTGPGMRLGVLLGGSVSPMFSINGELTIDFINSKNVQEGVDHNAFDFVLALSPLVHIPAGNLEAVFGPILGLRGASTEDQAGGLTAKSRASGLTVGARAGAFVAVTPGASLGGFVTAEIRTVSKYCSTDPGFAEVCSTDSAVTGPSDKVLGLNVAALF
jgi:hypothetical protein